MRPDEARREEVGKSVVAAKGKFAAMQASQDILDEMVQRIVETANPERIILFGSAARGAMGPHSDLDLLVVVANGVHRRKTAQSLYRRMVGLPIGADIMVATSDDLDEYGNDPAFVYRQALREGKELYHAG